VLPTLQQANQGKVLRGVNASATKSSQIETMSQIGSCKLLGRPERDQQ
jgi:hypothetical protein